MLFPTHGLPMEIHAADGKFGSCPIIGNIHDLVDFDEIPDFEFHDAAIPANSESHSAAPRRPR